MELAELAHFTFVVELCFLTTLLCIAPADAFNSFIMSTHVSSARWHAVNIFSSVLVSTRNLVLVPRMA